MTLRDYNVQNVSQDLSGHPQPKDGWERFFAILNADPITDREARLSKFSVYSEVVVSRVSGVCYVSR
jgi:hypothetical protein